jgi:N-acetylglutamate synthase-like GNAT family acetyltransferase
MPVSGYNVRRATIEDLPGLRQLWQKCQLPSDQLERRVTEFQIAESAEGLLASLGLQISKQQGLVHSESYWQPELKSDLGQPLWERIQVVARNHGLVRLWKSEAHEFWRSQGFKPAPEETLKKLPPEFGHSQSGWFALQLKEENAVSIEQEFEIFKQAHREESERTIQKARALKVVAVVIAVAILVLVILAGVYTLHRLPLGGKSGPARPKNAQQQVAPSNRK